MHSASVADAAAISDVRAFRCTGRGEIVSTDPPVPSLIGSSVFDATTTVGADVLRCVANEHRRSGEPVRFSIPLAMADGKSFCGAAEWDGAQHQWSVRRT